ncbi:MAG: hypothetical protein ABL984_07660 [Pyrinomonadaceae bacterium]
MPRILAAFTLAVLLLAHPAHWMCFETDQYNLPPTPLADIGGEVYEYTLENITKAIEKVNSEIVAKQECLDRPGCGSTSDLRKRLVYLRSEMAVARAVYDRLGYGIIAFARAGNWINSHKFRAQPARYKTSYRDSIFVSIPTDYFTISPTVKVYGVHFGTDKIAHFFQQGYQYYRIAGRAVVKGSSTQAAESTAVSWGRTTENTYYGTLVGGVFSNADLFANHIGMRFYEGLTRSVRVGDMARPATLILENGLWKLNAAGTSEEVLLRPFISDHLNEALNPSLYIPGLRSSIRGIVKKRSCPQWRAAYPTKTREDFQSLTDSLKLWNGENYGYKQSQKFVTIATTCFDDSTRTH